jgi:hypothetical protein
MLTFREGWRKRKWRIGKKIKQEEEEKEKRERQQRYYHISIVQEAITLAWVWKFYVLKSSYK